MNYLSEMLKLPVVDAAGEKIGIVNDLGIATGEVFPRVTALAFQGPARTSCACLVPRWVRAVCCAPFIRCSSV